ncbi:Protein Y25C1A.8, isoform a [Anopheles sinensis]|uniref:Protein Y25C1A.8, isoform a n=1 Tax=Anopheles sinensis TaxID=74873 RepID=A0A084W3M6_ANOSI|nr:Protein Y25C1A.8, isoform a [Anopheles sinensis]
MCTFAPARPQETSQRSHLGGSWLGGSSRLRIKMDESKLRVDESVLILAGAYGKQTAFDSFRLLVSSWQQRERLSFRMFASLRWVCSQSGSTVSNRTSCRYAGKPELADIRIGGEFAE